MPAQDAPSQNAPIDPAGIMLRECWYYALPANALKQRAMIHRTLLGEPVLIGRDETGHVFALRDTCPHRGTLLSRGMFDGREVQCPYHGWRFRTDGRCTAIPSQLPDQKPQAHDIRTPAYRLVERDGNIWIYMGTRTGDLPPVPEIPTAAGAPKLHVSSTFECNIDVAVSGLMDPAHGAFVHRSAVWRAADSIHEKQKAFSPLPDTLGLGWQMDRHRASRNSRAYRLFLGGAPETEINYRIPATRIEHAQTKKYNYVGLTACTPVTAKRTEVHHVMYWDVPGGIFLRPIVHALAKRFLEQDRRAVMAMQEGLAFNPATMLVQDADTQTRWYFRLKREHLAAQAEGRAARNPLMPVTLRWRS